MEEPQPSAAQPTSSHDSNDDDRLLLSKIQVLLGASTIDATSDHPEAYRDERLLIVCLLLSRITSDNKVQHVWKQYAPDLFSFCKRLLVAETETASSSSPGQTRHRPQHEYVILVCRLLARMKEASSDDDNGDSRSTIAIDNGLIDVLIGVLSKRCNDGATLTDLDVDLVIALNAALGTCAKDVDINWREKVLNMVWLRFQQVQSHNNVAADRERVKDAEHDEMSTDKTTVKVNAASEVDDDDDWKLVHETLNALLMNNVDQDEHTTLFQQAVLLVFANHGAQACTLPNNKGIPTWYPTMMKRIVADTPDSKIPSSVSSALLLVPQWHAVVLQCTQELAMHCPTELQGCLQQPSNVVATGLLKAILVSVTSSAFTATFIDGTGTSVSTIASLAWTTLAVMVETLGVDWMMTTDVVNSCFPSSSTGSQTLLGNATAVCTLLRLAAGEWRIQLGRLLCEDHNIVDNESLPSSPTTLEHSNKDANDAIAESCGRVIADMSHLLSQMMRASIETDDADLPTVLQGAALLHWRDSLRDALHATVQYLCDPLRQKTNVRVQAQACRMLGGLLIKLFGWNDLPEGIRIDEVLQAFRVALQPQTHLQYDGNESINDRIYYTDMLHALVLILMTAEDSSENIKLLEKHRLLDETLVNFLVSFWTNLGSAKDASQWNCMRACHVTEMWYSLVTPSPPTASVTAPIRNAVLKWLRRQVMTSHSSRSPNAISTMASANDGFIFLCGQDFVPCERDSIVIQRVFELVQASASDESS